MAHIISGTDEALISDANGTSGENTNTKTKPAKVSLRSSLLSLTCILHLYWLFVHALRFVTFIGFLNQWLLESLGNTEEFSDIVVREKKGEVEATQCNIIKSMHDDDELEVNDHQPFWVISVIYNHARYYKCIYEVKKHIFMNGSSFWPLVSYFSANTYAMGTQKRINETVLLSCPNFC